jgi:hypothetical protein
MWKHVYPTLPTNEFTKIQFSIAKESSSFIKDRSFRRLRNRSGPDTEGMMMSEDFTFAVMIDSELTERQLVHLLLNGLAGAMPAGGHYIEFRQNILSIEPNSLHDARKASAQDGEAWKYYRYCLSVFPKSDANVADQKSVATCILAAFHDAGMSPELVAEFEL